LPAVTPVRDGFRRVSRDPALLLAEIAWRWTFWLAALALFLASLLAYLDTLEVSALSDWALRSHTPWLVADALGEILQGSGPQLMAMIAILIPTVCLLWIGAASVGRAATVNSLVAEEGASLRSQLGLSALRAAVMLASLIGYLGAAILAARAAGEGDDASPGIFFAVFLLLAAGITIVRSRVNWFLFLAAIFAARRRSTFAALRGAVALFRRHAGSFAWTGLVFGLLHGFVFFAAAIACVIVFSVPGSGTKLLSAGVLLVIAILYCATADFLYVSRLAAYVAIDEADRTLPEIVAPPESPAPGPSIEPAPPMSPLPEGAA
jgi:hypothetical protein